MTNDYLFIEDIEISCRIGTTAEERAFPQIIHVSIQIGSELREAGRNDNFNATIDYALIIGKIKDALSKRKFQLVETVAETAATICLEDKRVEWTRVRVAKKVFAGIAAVGAFIERTQPH